VDPVTGDELDDEEKEVVETTELAKIGINKKRSMPEPEPPAKRNWHWSSVNNVKAVPY